MYEGFNIVFQDASVNICDLYTYNTLSPLGLLSLSSVRSKTAASCLQMKHCQPSTGFVYREIYWIEHIDAWAFETQADVTL